MKIQKGCSFLKPFAILIPLFYHIVSNKPFADAIAVISLSLSVLLAVIIFVLYRNQKNGRSIFIKLLPIVPLFLYVFFITYRDVAEVTRGKKYLHTRILLKNNTVLISDSTTYYIGKTENFVFIHHEVEGFTEIIPIAEIAKYQLRKKGSIFSKYYPLNRPKMPARRDLWLFFPDHCQKKTFSTVVFPLASLLHHRRFIPHINSGK